MTVSDICSIVAPYVMSVTYSQASALSSTNVPSHGPSRPQVPTTSLTPAACPPARAWSSRRVRHAAPCRRVGIQRGVRERVVVAVVVAVPVPLRVDEEAVVAPALEDRLHL